jgi:hypothetical protein
MAKDGWFYRNIASTLLWDEETISCHVCGYTSDKKLTLNSGGSEGYLLSETTAGVKAH